MNVPSWDEIIARTEHDMAAQNFLDRHGLWMSIQQRGATYTGTVQPFASGSWIRGQRLHGTPPARTHKQCSISFHGLSKRPVPRDVLAAMSVRSSKGSAFDRQRIRTFFGERELREIAEIV